MDQAQFRNLLVQLMLRDQDNSDYEELYRILITYLKYPSDQQARLHEKCNRPGISDLKQNTYSAKNPNDIVRCPCCGIQKQQHQLPLCTPISQVNNLGFPVNFMFKNMCTVAGMITILCLIFSVLAVSTNFDAAHNQLNFGTDAAIDYSSSLSLSAKLLRPDTETHLLYVLQQWCAIATVLLWVAFLGLMKRSDRKREIQIRNEAESSASFSIYMDGMPEFIKEDELLEKLEAYLKQLQGFEKHSGQKSPIVKVNILSKYYLDETKFKACPKLQEAIQKKKQLRDQLVLLIRHRQGRSHFDMNYDERQDLYRQYEQTERRIQCLIEHIKNSEPDQTEEVSSQNAQRLQGVFKQILKPKDEQVKTYSAIITLEHSEDKDLLVGNNRVELSSQVRDWFLLKSKNRFALNNEKLDKTYPIKIDYAPDPEQIVWENLGKSNGYRRKVAIVMAVVILLLLVASGVANYYAEVLKKATQKEIWILSFFSPLLITGVDYLISEIIKRGLEYERNPTKTYYHTSLALYSIVPMLLNSIAMPIIISHILEGNLIHHEGLVENIFYLGITNTILNPLFKMGSFSFLFHIFLKRSRKNDPDFLLTLDQRECNEFYERDDFEVGQEYLFSIHLLLFTCFFAPIQPILPFFALLELLITFMCQKFILYRWSKRPFPGTIKIHNTLNELVNMAPLFFSTGNLLWYLVYSAQNQTHKGRLPAILFLALSIIFYFIPFKRILPDLDFQQQIRSKKFSDISLALRTDYDRLNPKTREKQLQNHENKVNALKNQLKVFEIKRNNLTQHQTGQYNRIKTQLKEFKRQNAKGRSTMRIMKSSDGISKEVERTIGRHRNSLKNHALEIEHINYEIEEAAQQRAQIYKALHNLGRQDEQKAHWLVQKDKLLERQIQSMQIQKQRLMQLDETG